MAGWNHLGHQGKGNRQQAPGGCAHQETHRQVPAERRHRPADGGANEHQRRQQDGCAATEGVGDPAPQHRAHRRAGERDQREQPGGFLGDLIFVGHARHDEAEAGWLQNVYRQGNHEHDHQLPVLAIQRDGVGNVKLHDVRADALRTHLFQPRHQAEGSQRETDGNQGHADQHGHVHRHAHHPEAVVAPHPKHRHVREHTRDDCHAAEPDGPGMMEGNGLGLAHCFVQPFTPPAVRPETIQRCAARNTSVIGRPDNTAAAAKSPHRYFCSYR